MKRVLVISLAVVLTLCLSMVPVPANKVMAADVSPGESIQNAIDSASYGDIIYVAAGTYYENILLKDGVVVSGNRTGDTIISGSSGFPVVIATNNVDSNTKLDGFTITNGNASSHGGGITIETGSDPIISNCVITGNSATYHGGGIAVHGGSSPTIINCTVVENNAGINGGGIWVNQSSPTIINCISANNTALDGGGIYVSSGSSPTINYNNVWGNSTNNYSVGYSPGSDDISADPLFVNPEGGDYRLQSGSPCIDAGDNSAPNLPDTDKDGNARIINGTVDMGAYEAAAAITTYTITATAGSGGSISPSGEVTVDAGDNQTFAVLPDTGYLVEDVLVDSTSAGAVSEYIFINVTDNHTIHASFAIDTITIEIDIKPGSDPSSINPDSKGVIPVAILTTAGFDAASVNATTVSFGPDEASPVHYALEDVDDDGDTDMILHFKTQETGITAGDTEATLMGKTTGGIEIIGTDSVRTVPPKGKKGGK